MQRSKEAKKQRRKEEKSCQTTVVCQFYCMYTNTVIFHPIFIHIFNCAFDFVDLRYLFKYNLVSIRFGFYIYNDCGVSLVSYTKNMWHQKRSFWCTTLFFLLKVHNVASAIFKSLRNTHTQYIKTHAYHSQN